MTHEPDAPDLPKSRGIRRTPPPPPLICLRPEKRLRLLRKLPPHLGSDPQTGRPSPFAKYQSWTTGRLRAVQGSTQRKRNQFSHIPRIGPYDRQIVRSTFMSENISWSNSRTRTSARTRPSASSEAIESGFTMRTTLSFSSRLQSTSSQTTKRASWIC